VPLSVIAKREIINQENFKDIS